MTSSPELLLLGGHRAVDFLNTWRNPGQEIETLGDGAAWGRWLVATGLLEAGELPRLRRRFGEPASQHQQKPWLNRYARKPPFLVPAHHLLPPSRSGPS